LWWDQNYDERERERKRQRKGEREIPAQRPCQCCHPSKTLSLGAIEGRERERDESLRERERDTSLSSRVSRAVTMFGGERWAKGGGLRQAMGGGLVTIGI
jgi:pyruvate-formate lyase-activating enzyme